MAGVFQNLLGGCYRVKISYYTGLGSDRKSTATGGILMTLDSKNHCCNVSFSLIQRIYKYIDKLLIRPRRMLNILWWLRWTLQLLYYDQWDAIIASSGNISVDSVIYWTQSTAQQIDDIDRENR